MTTLTTCDRCGAEVKFPDGITESGVHFTASGCANAHIVQGKDLCASCRKAVWVMLSDLVPKIFAPLGEKS